MWVKNIVRFNVNARYYANCRAELVVGTIQGIEVRMKNNPTHNRIKSSAKNANGDKNGSGPLQPGTVAPNFELNSTPDQKVDLIHFRGRPVILAFYPADWSPVCGDQLALYNEILPDFNKYAAQLIGISVDGTWCHTAYAQNRQLHFPLLADFEPKGAVARMYGVYDDSVGECERALFVIDKDGIIRWSYVSPAGVNPGADGILRALESLDKKKELAHA